MYQGGLLYQLPQADPMDAMDGSLLRPRFTSQYASQRLLSTSDDMVHQTLSEALAHPLWLEKKQQEQSLPERSSTPDSEPISSRITLQGPSRLAVRTMRNVSEPAVKRLASKLMDCAVGLQTAHHLHRQPADTAKVMQQRLQDVHGIVVELDESLGCAVPLLASHLPSSVDSSESASSTPTSSSTPLGTTAAALAERAERAEAVEACRQWLKEAQSYVMHLQRQLESLSSTFAEDSPQWVQCVSYSAEALERTAQDIRAGGTEVSHGTSRSSSPDAWRPRAVARSAQLPYRSHWAHKVAL